jgi:hypothetical protein
MKGPCSVSKPSSRSATPCWPDDIVLRHFQAKLDIEEVRLARREVTE